MDFHMNHPQLVVNLTPYVVFAFKECNPNFVLVILCLACRKILGFFGVRTAVWSPLLLSSGAHFRRKPSNALVILLGEATSGHKP